MNAAREGWRERKRDGDGHCVLKSANSWPGPAPPWFSPTSKLSKHTPPWSLTLNSYTHPSTPPLIPSHSRTSTPEHKTGCLETVRGVHTTVSPEMTRWWIPLGTQLSRLVQENMNTMWERGKVIQQWGPCWHSSYRLNLVHEWCSLCFHLASANKAVCDWVIASWLVRYLV